MAWFTHASRFVFGDSLHAIRLLPAVTFGAVVLLTGFHHAGTRREALGHIAHIRLGAAHSFHPRQRHASFHESLEPLFWMGCIYFLLLAINRQQPKLLLWCGVLLGFGLENKHSTVFFLSALVVDC
jgi:4-amino-4-deoxy-L-arabinose transferase-like glycosyltransferase